MGDIGSLLVFILVGLIAGFLASRVVTGKGRGLLWDLVIGILGAFIGRWLGSSTSRSGTAFSATSSSLLLAR